MRTRGPGQSPLLLFDAVAILNRERIDYAVVGAMAGSVHGAIRASVDADAIISLAALRSLELEKQLQAAGFTTELRRGDMDDPISAVLSLTDSHGNRVDLLIGLRGMDSTAFSRAIEVDYHGEKLRVIGREDFIAMKAFAGGPQDLIDAQRALDAADATLDTDLMRKLAKGFGWDAVQALEQLLSRA